jgi:putative transposase
MGLDMPSGLHRTYGSDHLHFVTTSCYHRRPFLNSSQARDCFLSVLEATREKYRFVVAGYVVMPEHVHLLITEPEVGNPSTVMQVLKQRTAKALLLKRKPRRPRQSQLVPEERRSFWQERFYDFNVWSTRKRFEKLRYMHRNPVRSGLVESPEEWQWSSYRYYLLNELGPVKLDVGWGEISFRDRIAKTFDKICLCRQRLARPCRNRKDGAPE